MREIRLDELGDKFTGLINEENPLEEDIGVIDEDGKLRGVFITNEAYQFFLKKVEEEEDRIDNEAVDDFRKSGESDQ